MRTTIHLSKGLFVRGQAAVLGVFALLAVACGQAAPDEASTGVPALREASSPAQAALARSPKRPPPGLRRASAEEVQAKFGRMDLARERARTLAAQPENLDELLSRLRSSSNPTERSVLTNRYVAAANAIDAAERPAAITRLQQVLDATRGRGE
jgi:hypothetical protein